MVGIQKWDKREDVCGSESVGCHCIKDNIQAVVKLVEDGQLLWLTPSGRTSHPHLAQPSAIINVFCFLLKTQHLKHSYHALRKELSLNLNNSALFSKLPHYHFAATTKATSHQWLMKNADTPFSCRKPTEKDEKECIQSVFFPWCVSKYIHLKYVF